MLDGTLTNKGENKLVRVEHIWPASHSDSDVEKKASSSRSNGECNSDLRGGWGGDGPRLEVARVACRGRE
jgi:hypothetical protein